jgi:hypothetical protein
MENVNQRSKWRELTCRTCGKTFKSSRPDAWSCSDACRQYWARNGHPYPARGSGTTPDGVSYGRPTSEVLPPPIKDAIDGVIANVRQKAADSSVTLPAIAESVKIEFPVTTNRSSDFDDDVTNKPRPAAKKTVTRRPKMKQPVTKKASQVKPGSKKTKPVTKSHKKNPKPVTRKKGKV